MLERQLTSGMRAMLWAASLLVLLAGVPLFLGSEQTDLYFAWTIMPPLTAAFLGAVNRPRQGDDTVGHVDRYARDRRRADLRRRASI